MAGFSPSLSYELRILRNLLPNAVQPLSTIVMTHRAGGASRHKSVSVGFAITCLCKNHSQSGRFAIRYFEGLRSKFGRFAACHSEGFSTSYWKAFELSQVGLLAIVLCHSPVGLLSLSSPWLLLLLWLLMLLLLLLLWWGVRLLYTFDYLGLAMIIIFCLDLFLQVYYFAAGSYALRHAFAFFLVGHFPLA